MRSFRWTYRLWQSHMATRAIVAPGGPGLGPETLVELPLPASTVRVPVVANGVVGGNPLMRQADDIMRRLDETHGGPTILVGHSAGAYSCLIAAANRGHQIDGLVLFSVQLRERTDHPELLAQRAAAEERAWRAWAFETLATEPSRAPEDDAHLLRLALAMLRLTFPQIRRPHRRFLAACARQWDLAALRAVSQTPGAIADLRQLATRVTCPTLVINGERDPWTGAPSAQECHDHIPRCRSETVTGAGHAPWLDNPGAVRRLLAEFQAVAVGEYPSLPMQRCGRCP
jgi:proline iminopeptidase